MLSPLSASSVSLSSAAQTTPLRAISSMATRALLAELAQAWQANGGPTVALEPVGGVEAARRVAAGEAFDLVLLAADAIDGLMAQGVLWPGSRVDWARSPVAVAVRTGVHPPDVSSAAALQEALRAAKRIGVSTGPSGRALQALFERWGLAGALADRVVVPPPGTPVAALLARGEVDLGFQQLSEMLGVPGIQVLGTLPPEVAIVTVFSGAVGRTCAQPQAARAWLDYLCSPAAEAVKRRYGMS